MKGFEKSTGQNGILESAEKEPFFDDGFGDDPFEAKITEENIEIAGVKESDFETLAEAQKLLKQINDPELGREKLLQNERALREFLEAVKKQNGQDTVKECALYEMAEHGGNLPNGLSPDIKRVDFERPYSILEKLRELAE